MHEIEGPLLFEWLSEHLGHGVIPRELLACWFVFAILLIMAGAALRRISLRPGGIQIFFELVWEYIAKLCVQLGGEENKRLLPFYVTLFLFIMFSNWIGLIPGFASPTTNVSVNAALALIVAFSTEFLGIRQKGLGGYLKHFCGPPYWLFPIFVVIRGLEVFTRPLSLTMRLFGNMLAKEIILGVLVYMATLFFFSSDIIAKTLLPVPILLRPAIILLGVLVGLVQALVFTALSMSYIGSAFEKH
ncbi:MAG: F0F1 ATP synthase subunit A [Kiritimatiellae bacterium]|nr:F0F1 ATP synthase subunit A [Kiritimatiellia bacterium]